MYPATWHTMPWRDLRQVRHASLDSMIVVSPSTYRTWQLLGWQTIDNTVGDLLRALKFSFLIALYLDTPFWWRTYTVYPVYRVNSHRPLRMSQPDSYDYLHYSNLTCFTCMPYDSWQALHFRNACFQQAALSYLYFAIVFLYCIQHWPGCHAKKVQSLPAEEYCWSQLSWRHWKQSSPKLTRGLTTLKVWILLTSLKIMAATLR